MERTLSELETVDRRLIGRFRDALFRLRFEGKWAGEPDTRRLEKVRSMIDERRDNIATNSNGVRLNCDEMTKVRSFRTVFYPLAARISVA